MPRRTFTARDLKPFRKAAEKILEEEPDAALVASAARPFKRRIRKPEHVERRRERLPVEIRSKDRPDGVPLQAIAREARKEVPSLRGISARGGGVSLKFERPPSEEERKKLDSLFSDTSRLEGLGSPPVRARAAEAMAARPAEAMAVRPAELQRDPEEVLHDPESSDAAWLRAFRRYAMENLVEPPSD